MTNLNETIYFYDTCSLLKYKKEILNNKQKFYFSSVTLHELENIKTSAHKDEELKYNARQLLNFLAENDTSYEIVVYFNSYLKNIEQFDLVDNDDTKIIACAYNLQKNIDKKVVFVTSDLSCYKNAETVGLNVELKIDKIEDYTGYKIIDFSEEELADFYNNFSTMENVYNLLENQYLIIKLNNKIIAKYKWSEGQYKEVQFQKFDSRMFGKVVPKDCDPYQQIAMDSLRSNQLTMLRGPAGSGKSYLAFGYMFSLLEKGKIDKIIIFCNTVAVKGAAKLGYYPGSREEKLLDSQIGNLLSSKIGDRTMVEQMVDDGRLVLLPMSDIRGYDTTGMNAAVYISEAQNLDVELMRLALQRIGDDSICILDGDSETQVDLSSYAGDNNGMRRVSEVFKGKDFYGEVTLVNIHRSKIAEIAQLM